MTFNEQPSSICGAKSPLIYQFYDALYPSDSFYYECLVYVWSGTTTIPASPNWTIQRKPDQYGSGRGWIDIHKLVEQELNENYLVNGTYKPNIGNGAMRVAVKVRGAYLVGSTWTYTSYVTSNVVLATLGYSYTADGFNEGYSKVVFTDKNEVTITAETTSAYLWYDATIVTSITCGTATVTPNSVSGLSANTIQGIDIVQLMTAGGVSADTNITFVKSGDDVVIPVNVVCQNKYGQQDVLFLNKYGVYDSFLFNGVYKSNYSISSEKYQQPIYKQTDLAQAWTYGVGITTPYLVNSVQTMTVNTDWISQNDVDVVEQIFYSNNVLINGTQVLSARVVDTSFEYKTRLNEKLILYTIQLEYNQPKINKIVR
jgi:hypothetical protein